MQTIIPMVVVLVAVVAGVYFVLRQRKQDDAQPKPWLPPQPGATGWVFQYSNGIPAGQTPENFDFPSIDGVHYCVKRPPALAVGQIITMKFSITGNGTLVPIQGTKAYLTLYIQRAGDDMSGVGNYEYYRAFAGSSAVLIGIGDFTVSVPLRADMWGSVEGHNFSTSPDMFNQLLANAQNIGFVFGDPGAGATGHGVKVKDGTAHFTLASYEIA